MFVKGLPICNDVIQEQEIYASLTKQELIVFFLLCKTTAGVLQARQNSTQDKIFFLQLCLQKTYFVANIWVIPCISSMFIWILLFHFIHCLNIPSLHLCASECTPPSSPFTIPIRYLRHSMSCSPTVLWLSDFAMQSIASTLINFFCLIGPSLI